MIDRSKTWLVLDNAYARVVLSRFEAAAFFTFCNMAWICSSVFGWRSSQWTRSSSSSSKVLLSSSLDYNYIYTRIITETITSKLTKKNYYNWVIETIAKVFVLKLRNFHKLLTMDFLSERCDPHKLEFGWSVLNMESRLPSCESLLVRWSRTRAWTRTSACMHCRVIFALFLTLWPLTNAWSFTSAFSARRALLA